MVDNCNVWLVGYTCKHRHIAPLPCGTHKNPKSNHACVQYSVLTLQYDGRCTCACDLLGSPGMREGGGREGGRERREARGLRIMYFVHACESYHYCLHIHVP